MYFFCMFLVSFIYTKYVWLLAIKFIDFKLAFLSEKTETNWQNFILFLPFQKFADDSIKTFAAIKAENTFKSSFVPGKADKYFKRRQSVLYSS